MSMHDRVVVLSGAAGGAGRAVAHTLAEQGASLVLLGRNEEKLAALSKELNLPAERILTHVMDATDPASIQQAGIVVADKFGKADILINLVGGWSGGTPTVELPATEVEDMLQQHLWSTFYLVQAFLPQMISNSWGRVIAVSSPFAAHPRAKGAAYAIGKAAQEALLLTLSEELAGSGVTANMLLVKTIDVEHQRDQQPSPKNASWTTPEEIAASILYLCSSEAGTINGARIPLYGSM